MLTRIFYRNFSLRFRLGNLLLAECSLLRIVVEMCKVFEIIKCFIMTYKCMDPGNKEQAVVDGSGIESTLGEPRLSYVASRSSSNFILTLDLVLSNQTLGSRGVSLQVQV